MRNTVYSIDGSELTQMTFRYDRGESAKIIHGRIDSDSAATAMEGDAHSAHTMKVGGEAKVASKPPRTGQHAHVSSFEGILGSDNLEATKQTSHSAI